VCAHTAISPPEHALAWAQERVGAVGQPLTPGIGGTELRPGRRGAAGCPAACPGEEGMGTWGGGAELAAPRPSSRSPAPQRDD